MTTAKFVAMLSSVTVTFSSLVPLAFARCYWPNGVESDTDIPCGGRDAVVCCPPQWECISNGLCYYPNANYLGRYTCTAQNWDLENCPNICTEDTTTTNGTNNGNEAVNLCSDGRYCCNGNRSGNCCDDDADFFNLPQGTSTAYISTLGGLNGAGPTSGEDSPSPALTASATPSSQIGPQTSISNPDVDSKSSSLTAGEIAAIPSSISAAIFLAGIGIYIIRRRHLNHLAKKQDSNELGIPELGVSSSYLQEIDAVEPGTREIEVVENPSWEAGGRALIAELETHVERSELEGEKLDQIESG